MIKRVFDALSASIFLTILSPVFLVVGIAVRLDDGGPIFFHQLRVGRAGRLFTMYKFRSMVVNGPDLGGFSTEPDDFRITRVGRVIRRLSLDELPQLLNVLKGDMSFVGPRPDLLEQESLYLASEWSLRHSVRPGITGLAQATLRSEATPSERKQLDLMYVRSQSLYLDLKILMQTLNQLIVKGGN